MFVMKRGAHLHMNTELIVGSEHYVSVLCLSQAGQQKARTERPGCLPPFASPRQCIPIQDAGVHLAEWGRVVYIHMTKKNVTSAALC